jgi:hypothetical protein
MGITTKGSESQAFTGTAPDNPDASWRSTCLNCATPLTGPFCSRCGQRAVPPHPTVTELAGDAFGELSGWDGKLIETLRLLLTRPGALTRRFLDGQRVRYVSPVRLYLGCSIVYFLGASAAPNLRPGNQSAVSVAGMNIGVWTTDNRNGQLTPAGRDSISAAIDSTSFWLRPILRRALEDPEGFRRSMLQSMPRVLFALLPVFGLIVALFYRRRHYPEHLYFALHVHAFVFLALALGEVAKFTRSLTVATYIGVASTIVMLGYAALALRNVYGGGFALTVMKGVGILVVYSVVSIPALYGLVTWAALTG